MSSTTKERKRMVRVAQGLEPADVVIENATIADVLTQELYVGNVAIVGAYIACVTTEKILAHEYINAKQKILTPGFIDAHIHIESSMLSPNRFSEVVVPRGTVGVVAEPHEFVNVVGMRGLTWTLEAANGTPLQVWASVPSCVPASAFELGGSSFETAEIAVALKLPGVLGLAEMMNFPGVLNLDASVWSILDEAKNFRRDGHAAGLNGANLQAYAAAGLESDHEATTENEAIERLRAGLWLMVRQGSAARNLVALAPMLTRLQPARAMFVTDDSDAGELIELGHMDRILREAVKLGVPALYALRLATINPCEYWRLPCRGAIAPGYAADLVLLEDLKDFCSVWVMKAGKIVARDGALLDAVPAAPIEPLMQDSVSLPKNWDAKDLRIVATQNQSVVSVIGVLDGQIYTEHRSTTVQIQNGEILADSSTDLVKLAVVQRHKQNHDLLNTPHTGVCLAQGIGLKRGAIGITVLHDAHNMLLAGVNDQDMVLAAKELVRIGGGAVVVKAGRVLASLALPIAGLVTDQAPQELLFGQRAFESAARDLGCTLSHPITTLSFLGLSVIPSLKLTTGGLFDVKNFRLLNDEQH